MKDKEVEDPMIPKRIVRADAISTATLIGTAPTMSLPPLARSTSTALTNAANWSNPSASRTGGPPELPPVIDLSSGEQTFALAVGVYILASPTGAGKTVASMALAAWANARGIASSYISCFEPRSPLWKISNIQQFRKPEVFWTDAKRAIGTPGPELKVLIYDSGTLPMQAYSRFFPYQSTMKGGMQPSDRAFLDRGSVIAQSANACIIINMNSTLIPYVADLAGGVEGVMNVINVSTLTVSDRLETSKRSASTVTIPDAFVQSALDWFSYGKLRTTKISRGSLFGFTGI